MGEAAVGSEARLGFLSFLVAAAFVPGISGAGVVPRWAAIAIAVTLLPVAPGRTAIHWLGLALLSWCAITLAWTSNPVDGIGAIMKMGLLAAAFGVGYGAPSLRPAYVGCGCGVAVSSAVTVMQATAFPELAQPHTTFAPGLFVNSSVGASLAAMTLCALAYSSAWWLAAGSIPTLVVAQSRGAIIGIALAVWGEIVARHRYVTAVVLAGSAPAVLTALLIWRPASTSERWSVYRDTIDGLTWLGRGIGSFETSFFIHASRLDTMAAHPQHAHSDFLETIYELGPGAAIVIAICGLALGYGRPSERAALLCFLGLASVGFPWHLPATAFLVSMVVGHMARGCPPVRGCLWHWRNLLQRQTRPDRS